MPVSPLDLHNSNILITGPTGQVAAPIVDALSKIANVTALARFSKDSDKTALEQRGVKVQTLPIKAVWQPAQMTLIMC